MSRQGPQKIREILWAMLIHPNPSGSVDLPRPNTNRSRSLRWVGPENKAPACMEFILWHFLQADARLTSNSADPLRVY